LVTAVGTVFYQEIPVNNVMSVLLLFPITGLLTSIFILNETPNTYAYFGGAIIISGVAMILINKKKVKKNKGTISTLNYYFKIF
jgi:drug/metabolite transporter (DMT)-like permease